MGAEESTTPIGVDEPRPAVEAAEGLPKSRLKLQVHKVPDYADVLAIDDSTRQIILGMRESNEIILMNLADGKHRIESVPIIPRIALPLGEKAGLAVFGYARHDFKGMSFPSRAFLVLRGGEIEQCQLEEPIAVQHGVVWKQRGTLVMFDKASDTLAILESDDVQYAAENCPKASVPMARLVLENEPVDFEFVTDGALALSYAEQNAIDLLDMYESVVVSRYWLPQSVVGKARKPLGVLIEPLHGEYDSGRFLAMNIGQCIGIFEAPQGWRIEYSGLIRRIDDDLDGTPRRRSEDTITAFRASTDGKVWIGYKDRLLIYEVGEDWIHLVTSRDLRQDYSLSQIESIDFFDDYRGVVISSPIDGVILVADVEDLIALGP